MLFKFYKIINLPAGLCALNTNKVGSAKSELSSIAVSFI